MKKQTLFLAALFCAATIKAQMLPMGGGMQPMGMGAPPTQTWTTDLMTVPSGINADLGTANKNPLNFYTNRQKRVEIGIDGKVKILGLADSTIVGELRFLYVDSAGNLSLARQAPPGTFITCGAGETPWRLGGNILPLDYVQGGYVGNSNVIGHCSNTNLILQANSVKSLFLSSGGNVGVGTDNNNPSTTLDVSFPTQQGTRDHLRIYGNNDGAIEATADMHLYFNNNNGFTISGGSPATPFYNVDMLYMDAATGVSVYSKLNVDDNFSVNNNKFSVAASNGKTTIGNQSGAINTAQLNVNVNGGNAIDVFDASSSGSGNSKVNFRVKANGLVYSRELNVQLTDFPDYVFNKDYKLQSLENLDKYIKQNKHLPNVPTAAEIAENGANLGELSKIQIEKIEELTLYVIELKKEIEALKKQQSDK